MIRFRRWASLVLLIAVCAAPLVAHPALAQLAGTNKVVSPLPPPPAWAIGSRYAAAGDYTDAIKKLSDITSSASYRNTPYAPEAIYSIAHLYEDKLHDDNDAITQFNTLFNNYSSSAIAFPHKAVVGPEREALGVRIDHENRVAALKGPSDWSSIGSIKDAILASGYAVVNFFVEMTGGKNYSYWLALLLISVIVRLLLWPLSLRQYKSMKEMQRIAPLVKDLQAKYKNDKATLQQKQLELYKEHGVNPAAGCVPMLLQFPVFIWMYHAVWLYQYRFSHGTFLWICPKVHLLWPAVFGANLSDQDIPLLALYSVSMYVTQRMMPATDPSQAEMQRSSALMSSVLFFVLFQNYHFPSAFVLYWFFSNVVTTVVQKFVMRSSNFMLPALPIPGQPTDGDSTEGSIRNGSGALEADGGESESAAGSTRQTSPGTARGVIAPKTHPKKKRR
jgi:YidC/Oxa1 family membrane protein insertase